MVAIRLIMLLIIVVTIVFSMLMMIFMFKHVKIFLETGSIPIHNTYYLFPVTHF